MTITKITDLKTRCQENLPGQFRNSPRLRELVGLLGDEIQLSEDVTAEVLTERLLDNAVGEQLDWYGRILDEKRGSLADAKYRAVLKVALAIYQSDGTPAEIIHLAALLIDETIRYRQRGRACYTLQYETDSPVSGDWQERVARLLDRLRPGGVECAVVEGSTSPGPAFKLDSATAGLDNGKLCRRIL